MNKIRFILNIPFEMHICMLRLLIKLSKNKSQII
ncbi:MAG: hypothetical protein JWO44_1089 [Bacteroidetes bacterium]|nr:hypothetical protein [Bacteroidota bacterium]